MKNPSFRSLASRHSTLTLALGALLATHSAQAGNIWDGGGADGFWNNNLNWDTDTPPVSGTGSNLTFVGTSQLISQNDKFAAGTQFGSINFNSGAGAFVLSGNSIALNGSVNNNSASIQTVNLGLILTGGNKEASAILGSQLFIGGVVSQDGTARRLQATGQGIVTLNGTAANTYTGQTSASANGTLAIDLSNIAGNTNLVNVASQLNLGNGNAAAAGTLIIKGASSGASSQTLNGLSLATGTSGLVIVNANGGSGTTLNLGSGAGTRNAGSTITFDISSVGAALSGTTLGLADTAQTVNQAIRGYALVKDAGGTGFGANVSGALVRYTGGTALLTTGNVAANNATLAAGGTTTTLLSSQSVNSLNVTTTGGVGTLDLGVGNTLTLGQGAILAQGDSAFSIQNGQLGAANTEVILHAIGTGGVNISSTISSGTGSFTKSGSDAVTLSGNNIYSGSTTVVAGLLKAGSATAFSANSSYNLANSTGVGLALNGSDVTVGALVGGGTIGGGVALGSNTISVGGKNIDHDYSGIISGTGGVTKVGTGVWQVFGANTYTGATTISSGTLKARNGTALGISSALTLGGTGTLDLSGNNLSVGSLSGGGFVTNTNTNTNTSTLTTGTNNMNTTYSGVIRNGTTPATMITALTKTGTGELTLSGANTYTGNTTVNGGTLTLDTVGSMTFAIRASGSNNSILGTGALNLNGAFDFDLALAAASGTWNIVNVGTLNEAYGSGFHVNGFTEGTPDVWTFNNGTSIYTFTQATGILNGSLVPEPSSYLLVGIGVIGLMARRSRRKS